MLSSSTRDDSSLSNDLALITVIGLSCSKQSDTQKFYLIVTENFFWQ
jgi:hypothetical protein